MNVAVKPGYKLTEVGVIPDDWKVATISETMNLINGCAFKPSEWSNFGLPIIRIQNLNDAGANFNHFPGLINERNRILEGDLLFAWSGTLGSSFGARIWPGPVGVLNQHIFKVIPDQKKLTTEYAYFVFSRIEEDIAKKAHGFKSSFVHVKKSDLDSTFLPIPNIAEQRAIATALSDMDALISGLDQLIAKKRDLKQAAMQQLLTGQQRLPGFSGEWVVKTLGESIDLLSGFPFPSDSYSDSGVRLLRGSNVKRGQTDWSDETTQFWPSINHEIAKYEVKVGDLVISMDGSLVGRSYARIVEADLPALLLQRVARIRSRTIDIGYLTQFVGSHFFTTHCDSVKTVTAIPHISADDIRSFSIPTPPTLEEQTAIAAILSDLDSELAIFDARRDKARQLKQGMMQELLTGRIRLL